MLHAGDASVNQTSPEPDFSEFTHCGRDHPTSNQSTLGVCDKGSGRCWPALLSASLKSWDQDKLPIVNCLQRGRSESDLIRQRCRSHSFTRGHSRYKGPEMEEGRVLQDLTLSFTRA